MIGKTQQRSKYGSKVLSCMQTERDAVQEFQLAGVHLPMRRFLPSRISAKGQEVSDLRRVEFWSGPVVGVTVSTIPRRMMQIMASVDLPHGGCCCRIIHHAILIEHGVCLVYTFVFGVLAWR